MNERMNEWMNEWMIEWIIELMNEFPMYMQSTAALFPWNKAQQTNDASLGNTKHIRHTQHK